MSSAGSKDLRAPIVTTGRAIRTLGSLRGGLGRIAVVEGTEEAPLRVIRTSMGKDTMWRWLSGRGLTALFEGE